MWPCSKSKVQAVSLKEEQNDRVNVRKEVEVHIQAPWHSLKEFGGLIIQDKPDFYPVLFL